MTMPYQKDILLGILKNKIKVSILAFFYITSLFLMLRSGAFFQYFTSAFNSSNCYECSMKIDYIKQFYFSLGTFIYFFPATIIFISSLFLRRRLQSYITILTVIWIALTLTDTINSVIAKDLTLSYFLLNVIYNLAGGVLLSLFVCVSNSIVFHLHKAKGLSIFLSAMVPFIASIIITLALTVLVYLLYSRQPVEIELDVSEGANIAYKGGNSNEDSFGFLNDKLTNTPTYIDALKNGELIYRDNKGISSANIFFVSGCYAMPSLIDNPPIDKNKTIANTTSIVLKQDLPMEGYIQGETINVTPHGASQLSLTKDDKEYMLASRITKSRIEFKSNNSKITAAFHFMPIKNSELLSNYTYDIIINDIKYTIINTVEPLSRLDANKKMRCNYQQFSIDNRNYTIKGKYLTGILISVTPDDIVVLKDSPSLLLNADFAFYKKTYPKLEKIYDDISNGKLLSLRGEGFSQLIVNGKKQELKPESEIIISSGNLVGLVNKNKKIKIYGTADLLFVDNKMLNLRKITYLQSKLVVFGSSTSDIVKYLFSMGFLAIAVRLIYSYFRKELNENLFI
ncbi:hypothetical protein B1H39_11820 [Serratia marcescens]|nr:hypothetical protein B1H39_11820 [Serratia marcescens]